MKFRNRGYIEKGYRGRGWIVGARGVNWNYRGIPAKVFIDGGWLWIETDDNDGSVMLNIEALPFLRKALYRLSKKAKK